MKNSLKTAILLPALLVAGPLLAAAQAQATTQDSLLRQGDLVGGRPHASVPRPAATTRRAATATVANADPVLTRMLHESVDIGRVPASQLSDLYSRFLEATRSQRKQWSARDWDDASATLARLNERYEAVRLDLPLDERINVRSYQGEFRTLQGARRVKDRLDN